MIGRRVTLRLLDVDLKPLGQVVVDDVFNGDARIPVQMEATVTCDLGHEHGVGRLELAHWPALVRKGL